MGAGANWLNTRKMNHGKLMNRTVWNENARSVKLRGLAAGHGHMGFFSLLSNQWCLVLSTVHLCLVIAEILQCGIGAQWEESSQAVKQDDVRWVSTVFPYFSNRVIGLWYIAKTIMQKRTWLCEFSQHYPTFLYCHLTLIFLFHIMALSSCSPISSPLWYSQLKPIFSTYFCTLRSARLAMVVVQLKSSEIQCSFPPLPSLCNPL